MSPRRHGSDDDRDGIAEALARWDAAQGMMRIQPDPAAPPGPAESGPPAGPAHHQVGAHLPAPPPAPDSWEAVLSAEPRPAASNSDPWAPRPAPVAGASGPPPNPPWEQQPDPEERLGADESALGDAHPPAEPRGAAEQDGPDDESPVEATRTEPHWQDPDRAAVQAAGPNLAGPNLAGPERAHPKGTEPERADPNLAESSERADPNLAESERAERNLTEPSLAKPNLAEPNLPEPERADPERAEANLAGPERAGPERAGPGLSDPGRAPDLSESEWAGPAGADRMQADWAPTDLVADHPDRADGRAAEAEPADAEQADDYPAEPRTAEQPSAASAGDEQDPTMQPSVPASAQSAAERDDGPDTRSRDSWPDASGDPIPPTQAAWSTTPVETPPDRWAAPWEQRWSGPQPTVGSPPPWQPAPPAGGGPGQSWPGPQQAAPAGSAPAGRWETAPPEGGTPEPSWPGPRPAAGDHQAGPPWEVPRPDQSWPGGQPSVGSAAPGSTVEWHTGEPSEGGPERRWNGPAVGRPPGGEPPGPPPGPPWAAGLAGGSWSPVPAGSTGRPGPAAGSWQTEWPPPGPAPAEADQPQPPQPQPPQPQPQLPQPEPPQPQPVQAQPPERLPIETMPDDSWLAQLRGAGPEQETSARPEWAEHAGRVDSGPSHVVPADDEPRRAAPPAPGRDATSPGPAAAPARPPSMPPAGQPAEGGYPAPGPYRPPGPPGYPASGPYPPPGYPPPQARTPAAPAPAYPPPGQYRPQQPDAVAAPPRPEPLPAPTVDELTAHSLLRQRRAIPQSGWRRAIYTLSAHAVNPGRSPAELQGQQMIARATVPVRGCYRIAVISLKGGVGKTTTTVCLGATLASLRGDRVIAVDANPDRGTLSGKIPLETVATVRNLLNDADRIHHYFDVRRYTSQSPDRLEVLASESDPAMSIAFSEQDYRTAAAILDRYYNIVLTDCGTGLLHSAMAGVLALADQIVLVSSGSVDGARSASATLDWLEAHGYNELVRESVAVINSVRPKSGGVDLDKLEAHFAARCRAVARLPYDPHLEEGAEVDLGELRLESRTALLELAADVADGFPREAPPAVPPPPFGPRFDG